MTGNTTMGNRIEMGKILMANKTAYLLAQRKLLLEGKLPSKHEEELHALADSCKEMQIAYSLSSCLVGCYVLIKTIKVGAKFRRAIKKRKKR